MYSQITILTIERHLINHIDSIMNYMRFLTAYILFSFLTRWRSIGWPEYRWRSLIFGKFKSSIYRYVSRWIRLFQWFKFLSTARILVRIKLRKMSYLKLQNVLDNGKCVFLDMRTKRKNDCRSVISSKSFYGAKKMLFLWFCLYFQKR